MGLPNRFHKIFGLVDTNTEERSDHKEHCYGNQSWDKIHKFCLCRLHSTGVPNGLEDHNADARRLNSIDSSTLREQLVRFSPVRAEFTRLKRVHQTSISTQVSLTTYTRSWHCYALRRSGLFYNNLPGDDIARPSELHTRLCHAFLVFNDFSINSV